MTALHIRDVIVPALEEIRSGLFCLHSLNDENVALYPGAWQPLARHLEEQLGKVIATLNLTE